LSCFLRLEPVYQIMASDIVFLLNIGTIRRSRVREVYK
jgi:hypothetical protein